MPVDWRNVKMLYDSNAMLHINAVDCCDAAKRELDSLAAQNDLDVVDRPPVCYEIIMPCPPEFCPPNLVCGPRDAALPDEP
jgi:hypothetical protein